MSMFGPKGRRRKADIRFRVNPWYRASCLWCGRGLGIEINPVYTHEFRAVCKFCDGIVTGDLQCHSNGQVTIRMWKGTGGVSV